ncbi:hypothetical protein CLOP_g10341 [Closterium sp. NIES-67]|nr:hypothetical protein CLOP_g10341 [Closterium sp. NIES-67]
MYRRAYHATRTDRCAPPAGLSPCAGDAEQQLVRGPSGGAGGCGGRASGAAAKEPALPRCTSAVGSGVALCAPAPAAELSLDDSDLASVVSESWTKCAASRRVASAEPSAFPAAGRFPDQGLPRSAANASSTPHSSAPVPPATAAAGAPGSLSTGSLCGRFAAWGCADPLVAFEHGALLRGDTGMSHAAAQFPRAHPSAQASAGRGLLLGSSASSISTSCRHSALHPPPFSPSAPAGIATDCAERTADSAGARWGQGDTRDGCGGGVVAGGGSSSGGRKRSAGGSSSAAVVVGTTRHGSHHPASAVLAGMPVAVGAEEAIGEAMGEGMAEAMGCWGEGVGEAGGEGMWEGLEVSEYLSLPDDLAWCAWPACDQVAVPRAGNPAAMPAGLSSAAGRADEDSELQSISFCRAHHALTSDARVRGGCLMSLLARMDADGVHAHQPPAPDHLSAPLSAHSPAPLVAPIAPAASSPHQWLQQLPPPAAQADAAGADDAAALQRRADAVAGLGAATAPVAGGGARGGGAADGAWNGEGVVTECFLSAPLPDTWFRGLEAWEDEPRAQEGAPRPHAAAREGERGAERALRVAAACSAGCPVTSPLAAAPSPAPAAQHALAAGPSSGAVCGVAGWEGRQRSSRAAAAAADGAGVASNAAAAAPRPAVAEASVGGNVERGGSGAVAGGMGMDPGAAAARALGNAGGGTFMAYHLWPRPAAALVPPMLFVHPPFPSPPHLLYAAGAASAVMPGHVPVGVHPHAHSASAMALARGPGSPRLFSALPAALAAPPSAPTSTAPAAVAPSTTAGHVSPLPAVPARAATMLTLHPAAPRFPPPAALYPAPPSLHAPCAARSAAAMMMAAATATAMASRRCLLGLAGEPALKRKRGRQKKAPPHNGPCGATTNLRRIAPRGGGDEQGNEVGAGAQVGEARGGAVGSRGKGAAVSNAGRSGSGGAGGEAGQGRVARGLRAAGVGAVGPVFMPRAYVPYPLTFHSMPHVMHAGAMSSPFTHLAIPSATAAVSDGASDGAAATVAPVVVTAAASPSASLASPTAAAAHDCAGSDTAFAAADSTVGAGSACIAAAPNCAPCPAPSSLEPPSFAPPYNFPATATVAAAVAEGVEGRVHGARLVSRILEEMGGVDAEDCAGGRHQWKLAELER